MVQEEFRRREAAGGRAQCVSIFSGVSSALTAVAFMAGKSGTPAPHTNPGVSIAITNS